MHVCVPWHVEEYSKTIMQKAVQVVGWKATGTIKIWHTPKVGIPKTCDPFIGTPNLALREKAFSGTPWLATARSYLLFGEKIQVHLSVSPQVGLHLAIFGFNCTYKKGPSCTCKGLLSEESSQPTAQFLTVSCVCGSPCNTTRSVYTCVLLLTAPVTWSRCGPVAVNTSVLPEQRFNWANYS